MLYKEFFFSLPAVICGLFITGFAFVVPMLGKFVIQVFLFFVNRHSAASIPKNFCRKLLPDTYSEPCETFKKVAFYKNS